MPYKNKERKNANISLIIMFIGIIAVLLPFLSNADLESWGFAVAFIGMILAVTMFFVFLMFNGRAKVQNRIFNNENIMAHWKYSKEFWDRIQTEDTKDAGIGRIFGFFFGGIFTLIGIIVFAVDPEENALFLLFMLGIAIFFVIIGFISTSAEKKRVNASLPEAIIAQEGLFYKNILYTWNTPAISFLESVTLHPVVPGTILFVLRQLSGGRAHISHYHRFYLAIPVPSGEEQSAASIIQYFNMPMRQDRWERMQQTGGVDIADNEDSET